MNRYERECVVDDEAETTRSDSARGMGLDDSFLIEQTGVPLSQLYSDDEVQFRKDMHEMMDN